MKKSLSWYPISIWALLSISQVQAEMCTPPRLESNLNLSLPCVSLRGNNYAVKLNFDNTGGGYNWRLDPDIKPASCEWNVNACVT